MPASLTRPSSMFAAVWLGGMTLLSATALAAPFAYVPNQKSGTVSVIDTETETVVRTLSGQGQLGKRLQAIDIDARGKTLYLVDAEHDFLVALDPASDTITHKVEIGKDAEGVRLSPSGTLLAVCAEGQNWVLLVDVKTFAITAKIPVQGRNPEHCQFTADGKTLVTSNEGSDNLDLIDVAQHASTGVIASSGHPRGAAFLPGTSRLYVAQETANAVDIIDVAQRKKIATIAAAVRTAGITISNDGKRVYAANGGAGSVSVIDVATNTVIKEIAVGKRPWNMAMTKDGKKLYVANGRSNSVSVIDTHTLKASAEIPVGELPWGVAIAR